MLVLCSIAIIAIGAFAIPIYIVVLILCIMLPLISATIFDISTKANWDDKRKIVRRNIIILLVFYLLCIVSLLFFGGRGEYDYSYLKPNFVPFNNTMSYSDILMNLVIFTPLSFFAYVLVEQARKFVPHILGISVLLAILEVIQTLTLRGVFDINDIILNLIGVVVIFWLMKLPIVNILFYKTHLMVKDDLL